MSKHRNLLGCLDTKRHRCKVGIKAARQIKSYAVKIFNYNHERVLKRHTEDNSPKYHMVENDDWARKPNLPQLKVMKSIMLQMQ